jgi:phage baseplate assembly protein W
MAIVLKRNAETSLSIQQEHYSDFLGDLDFHPTKKDLLRNTNEEAVKQAIRNLLLTNRGDRIYNIDYGSDIRKILFENFSPAMESVLADLIRTAIENHEPRAKVIDIFVDSNVDDHFVVVTLIFSVINKEEPITLELILNRIR